MDIFRIVQFPYRGARPITVRDMNNGTTVENVRDTLKIIPATKNQAFSESQTRFGGSTLANETHSNGQIEAEMYINAGTTADASEALMEGILKDLETLPGLGKRYIEWRPDGGSYSTFFEIRANMPYDPMYRWVVFRGTKTLHLKWAVAVAPLAEGMPMYGVERFNAYGDGSTLADWTFGAGASSDVALSTDPTGPYKLTTVTNHSTQKLVVEALRNYSNSDWSASVAFTPGATLTGFRVGVILKYVNATNYVAARVDDNGSISTISVVQVVAGAETAIGAPITMTRLVAGTTYVLDAAMNGAVVYAQCGIPKRPTSSTVGIDEGQFFSPFSLNWPLGTVSSFSAATAPAVTSAVLSEAVSGKVGFIWTPIHASATISEFAYAAFAGTSSAQDSAKIQQSWDPSGTIPGTAPAKVDFYTRATAIAHAFGMVAWANRPGVFDYVWNGDFESNTLAGWGSTNIAGLNSVAGASFGPATTGAQGLYAAQVLLPTNADSGVNFPVYGEFKKGQTYTFSALARLASGSPTSIFVGAGTDAVNRGRTSAALTASFAPITGTWTPTADVNKAWVYISRDGTGAGSSTIVFDAVKLYKGTVAPTAQTQMGGRGAYPTFGELPAAAYSDVSASGGSIGQSAAGKYTDQLLITPGAGSGSATASYWIDPNIITPDEFGQGSVQVEVWGYVSNGSISTIATPRQVLSAISGESNSITSGPQRYTEFGTVGNTLTTGFQRLGVLNFPVASLNEGGRWKLQLQIKWGPGSSGTITIPLLAMVLADQRMASPTGITLDSSYPYFIKGAVAGGSVYGGKLLTADGQGFFHQASPEIDALYLDHGLGGQLPQLEPGTQQSFVSFLGDTLLPPSNAVAPPVLRALVTPRFNLVRGA